MICKNINKYEKPIFWYSIRFIIGLCVLVLYFVVVVLFARDPSNYTDREVWKFSIIMAIIFGLILTTIFMNPCTGGLYLGILSVTGGAIAIARREYDFYSSLNIVREATYFDIVNNYNTSTGFLLPIDKWTYNLDKSAISYYNDPHGSWFGIVNLEYTEQNSNFNTTNQIWVINYGDTSSIPDLFNNGLFDGYLTTISGDHSSYIRTVNTIKYKQKLTLPSDIMIFQNDNFDEKLYYYINEYRRNLIIIYVVFDICLFIDLIVAIILIVDEVNPGTCCKPQY